MDTCPICTSNQASAKFPFRKYQVYACSNCGFQWLHPQPTAEELSKIYTNEYFLGSEDFDTSEIVKKLKRATAEMYLEQLLVDMASPHQNTSSLLEIGCGMGDFLLAAQARGFQVSGLEVTDYLVEYANKRLGLPGVRKGYIESSNFEKASFDIIAFFDVIEHVQDPIAYMENVKDLLKESGKIYLVTPSLDSWSAKLLGSRWMEYKVEHLSYFNRRSLAHLLEKTGFKKIKFHPNFKMLSLDYINHHFVRFPVRGVSPLVNIVRRLSPGAIAHYPIRIVASGMAVTAEKQ